MLDGGNEKSSSIFAAIHYNSEYSPSLVDPLETIFTHSLSLNLNKKEFNKT